MATITTINAGDQISASRSVINTNFANLNSDKVETSAIDTDTTLSANSDSRIPSQKAVKAYVDALGGLTNLVPIGTVLPFAGGTLPTYYLWCDGTAVSRSTYANLFAIIGTDYGSGNGSTTFNLPDLRGSFPLGGGTRTRTATFDGASAVDPTTDEITVSSNDWLHTGQLVALTGSSLPTGLSAQNYYVIRISATVIKLASSLANAQSGTAVNITADGSGTCTLTQTLTARTKGETGGEETHAQAAAEVGPHQHGMQFNDAAGAGGGFPEIPGSAAAATVTYNTQANALTSAMNVMNPYTVMGGYIIKF